VIDSKSNKNICLIEAGFPCHQVGAETQRERGASSALPPLYYLHVWWARRPLTPSRAAILGSLLPAGTDPDWFLRQLGIEKVQALVNGVPWTLEEKLFDYISWDNSGLEKLEVNSVVERALQQEQSARAEYKKIIREIYNKNPLLRENPIMQEWEKNSIAFPEPFPRQGMSLSVIRVAANPAWFNGLMEIAASVGIRVPNLYGYSRAYAHQPNFQENKLTILDPTAGGGSIPFEALRLGHRVIANDLNPVASVILHATLDFPVRFGPKPDPI
jgi:putative DNA methylase